MLAYKFKAKLGTSANIIIWRYAAITISRKHLSGKGFKRNYDGKEEPAAIDSQAGHSSVLAGQIYARGIEEALVTLYQSGLSTEISVGKGIYVLVLGLCFSQGRS